LKPKTRQTEGKMSQQRGIHCAHTFSNLSRRDLLKRLGMSAAGILYAQNSAKAVQAKKVLDFWGTATLDIKKDWQQFTKATGIAVTFYDNGNDPGPVVQQLVQERQADWRHISGLQGGAEAELAKHNAIIPWDTSRIANYDKRWDVARNIEYTTVNGECYGIPTIINADSMIYRPDLAGPVESYEAIFDPLLKGKTAMEDAWINSVIMAAIYLKENGIFTIGQPGNLTETELRQVMSFLTEKAREGQFCRLWNGWSEAVNLIVSGEAYVMTGWEPIAIEARNRGVNAEYAEPREGFECWSNDLLLHPGARKAGLYDAAHQFAGWELSGYYGCVIAQQRGYAVPTEEAVNYAKSHPKEFNPQEIQALTDRVHRKFLVTRTKYTYWQNVMPDNRALYEEEWTRFRSVVNRVRTRK
jgi:putative spermidine/putrescine transport system substrate-binding protein